jgi:cell wall assembly regulator SMI1
MGMSQEQLPALLARLEAWLRAHRPGYVERLAPPASVSALLEVERQSGALLPDEIWAIYAWHDGQSHSGWSLVGRFWLMPLQQLVAQRKEGADAGKDLDDPEWWSDGWFPFADDGQGNLLCVDRSTGSLIQYFQDDPDRDPVAPSATGFIAALVEGLESGVLCPDKEDWAGCVPQSDAAWGEIRARHGVTIPVAYAPRT